MTSTSNTKFLVIVIENSLSWNAYIDQLIPKLCTACCAIRAVKPLRSQDTLKLEYYSCFHSHMNYLLTPWSRVLLEKLTVNFAASQEILCIYGTWKFLTVPTSARHLSLSWANSIQSPQPPPTSWRSILILPSQWKMLRKLKWQLPGEPLAARYNWRQGPVPAVEKHWCRAQGQPYLRITRHVSYDPPRTDYTEIVSHARTS
jgi:hypothetical protein